MANRIVSTMFCKYLTFHLPTVLVGVDLAKQENGYNVLPSEGLAAKNMKS